MGLPQREGRPSLDIRPEANPGASWDEHYGNVGANKLNHPVPVGSVQAPYHNGWERAGEEEYAFNPAAKKDKL